MTAIGLSLAAVGMFGYFVVGPANRGYSWRAWAVLVAFLGFMYLFTLIIALIIGGAIDGRPVAPLQTELIALVYSAAAAIVTGVGAGLRTRRDHRRSARP